MLLKPHIETPLEIHRLTEWTRREAMRHYVRCRFEHAEVNYVLNVWLRGPRCESCQASEPYGCSDLPAISSRHWKDDVAIEVGVEAVRRMQTALASGEDPSWTCLRCHGAISPWDGDDVWIAVKHLELDHWLSTDAGPKRSPSDAMRSQVLELYDRRCFGCQATARTSRLTIDHIIPQSRGGDAAFRNLQPLCEACQQRKADMQGEEIEVYDDMYFSSPPGDFFEGLFW